MLNNIQQIHLKLLEKAIQNTEESTGGIIGNKISDKITKVSKILPKNSLKAIKNEHDK